MLLLSSIVVGLPVFCEPLPLGEELDEPANFTPRTVGVIDKVPLRFGVYFTVGDIFGSDVRVLVSPRKYDKGTVGTPDWIVVGLAVAGPNPKMNISFAVDDCPVSRLGIRVSPCKCNEICADVEAMSPTRDTV